MANELSDLLGGYRDGYGLPQALYLDERIYQAELQAIWRAGWLFAGHSVEIPNPGDYFLYQLGTEALIVSRSESGEAAAVHNVCRHRGARLLSEPHGQAGRFICPYHQWTYAADGRLMTCRGMPDELDKSQWGLKRVAAREMEGLIFICLADQPPDFEPARALMAPMMRPQGLGRARLAYSEEYCVPANWKIVWENNRECYHCEANHPQYVKANFDRYEADNLSDEVRQRIEDITARSQARWEQTGLALTHTQAGLFHFPDAEGKTWYSANRTPLAEGYLTESLDGQPVAPRMGDYLDPQVGTLRLRSLPNFWCHASSDYAVTTRVTPAGPRQTLVRVTWLVEANAQPGPDYQLERLLPFWKLTSEQDWEICANVQRGVESPAYTPGPLSPLKEYNVISFLRWYVQRIQQDPAGFRTTGPG